MLGLALLVPLDVDDAPDALWVSAGPLVALVFAAAGGFIAVLFASFASFLPLAEVLSWAAPALDLDRFVGGRCSLVGGGG